MISVYVVYISYALGALAGLWFCVYRRRTYFYIQFGWIGAMTLATSGAFISFIALLIYFVYCGYAATWRARVAFWLVFDCRYSVEYSWRYAKDFGNSGFFTAREAVSINESFSSE